MNNVFFFFCFYAVFLQLKETKRVRREFGSRFIKKKKRTIILTFYNVKRVKKKKKNASESFPALCEEGKATLGIDRS